MPKFSKRSDHRVSSKDPVLAPEPPRNFHRTINRLTASPIQVKNFRQISKHHQPKTLFNPKRNSQPNSVFYTLRALPSIWLEDQLSWSTVSDNASTDSSQTSPPTRPNLSRSVNKRKEPPPQQVKRAIPITALGSIPEEQLDMRCDNYKQPPSIDILQFDRHHQALFLKQKNSRPLQQKQAGFLSEKIDNLDGLITDPDGKVFERNQRINVFPKSEALKTSKQFRHLQAMYRKKWRRTGRRHLFVEEADKRHFYCNQEHLLQDPRDRYRKKGHTQKEVSISKSRFCGLTEPSKINLEHARQQHQTNRQTSSETSHIQAKHFKQVDVRRKGKQREQRPINPKVNQIETNGLYSPMKNNSVREKNAEEGINIRVQMASPSAGQGSNRKDSTPGHYNSQGYTSSFGDTEPSLTCIITMNWKNEKEKHQLGKGRSEKEFHESRCSKTSGAKTEVPKVESVAGGDAVMTREFTLDESIDKITLTLSRVSKMPSSDSVGKDASLVTTRQDSISKHLKTPSAYAKRQFDDSVLLKTGKNLHDFMPKDANVRNLIHDAVRSLSHPDHSEKCLKKPLAKESNLRWQQTGLRDPSDGPDVGCEDCRILTPKNFSGHGVNLNAQNMEMTKSDKNKQKILIICKTPELSQKQETEKGQSNDSRLNRIKSAFNKKPLKYRKSPRWKKSPNHSVRHFVAETRERNGCSVKTVERRHEKETSNSPFKHSCSYFSPQSLATKCESVRSNEMGKNLRIFSHVASPERKKGTNYHPQTPSTNRQATCSFGDLNNVPETDQDSSVQAESPAEKDRNHIKDTIHSSKSESSPDLSPKASSRGTSLNQYKSVSWAENAGGWTDVVSSRNSFRPERKMCLNVAEADNNFATNIPRSSSALADQRSSDNFIFKAGLTRDPRYPCELRIPRGSEGNISDEEASDLRQTDSFEVASISEKHALKDRSREERTQEGNNRAASQFGPELFLNPNRYPGRLQDPGKEMNEVLNAEPVFCQPNSSFPPPFSFEDFNDVSGGLGNGDDRGMRTAYQERSNTSDCHFFESTRTGQKVRFSKLSQYRSGYDCNPLATDRSYPPSFKGCDESLLSDRSMAADDDRSDTVTERQREDSYTEGLLFSLVMNSLLTLVFMACIFLAIDIPSIVFISSLFA